MLSLVMLAATAAPGQYPYEEVNRLINDRIIYGGYGTYSGGYATYAGTPVAPYAGACYGPAVCAAPFHFTGASNGSSKEHKEMLKKLDEVNTSVEKLADALLNLEKKLAAQKKAGDAKFKAMEDQVKAVEKKQKKIVKKVDARIKPIEEKVKETASDLKALAKHVEEKERAAEIKGLEDKIKKLEDSEKVKQLDERYTGNDRQKSFESRLMQLEQVDKKRDDAILQFLEQKLDRFGDGIKRELDSVREQLRKFDGQIRDEKDGRLRLEDRLRNLERGLVAPPPPAPKEFKSFPKDNPREKDKEETMPPPEVKLIKVSQTKAQAPKASTTRANLTVVVPADARVYLNGKLTQSQGTVRTFYTPELDPGVNFSYTVRVEWVKNASLHAETRQVGFYAGSQVRVVFDPQEAQVRTAQAR